METVNDQFSISEEKYNDLIIQHENGKLIIFIDTASFRQLFSGPNLKRIEELTDVSLTKESIIIKTIFFTIPITGLIMSLLIILGFEWWAFLVLPVALIISYIIHTRASVGVQKIQWPIGLFFFVLAFSLVDIDNELLKRLSMIFLALQILLSKLLYFLTAKFAFNLLLNNYKFFALFYYKRIRENNPMRMIWIETPQQAI